MIRKTVVLLLLLGMFFIPILSAMSYPIPVLKVTYDFASNKWKQCTPSPQLSQQSVHSPKSIGETNRTKKRCAPQSSERGQLQIPVRPRRSDVQLTLMRQI